MSEEVFKYRVEHDPYHYPDYWGLLRVNGKTTYGKEVTLTREEHYYVQEAQTRYDRAIQIFEKKYEETLTTKEK